MAKVMLLCVALTSYPYSLTPGGVKADYYASHDFPAWVDMRFAGEIYWVHTTVHRGEGLTNDGRRARCGNHFRTELPPGAKRLPPAFKFLAPILDNPLPELNDEPPAVSLGPPQPALPSLTPRPENLAGPVLLGPDPILPMLIPSCDNKDNNCKKKKKPNPTLTPEPSAWVLISIGLALIAIKQRATRSRTHKRAPSAVDS